MEQAKAMQMLDTTAQIAELKTSKAERQRLLKVFMYTSLFAVLVFRFPLVTLMAGLLVISVKAAIKVPTGHHGVKVRFGKMTSRVLNPGLAFVWPWVDTIEIVDCRTKRITCSIDSINVDLTYRPNPRRLPKILHKYGPNFQDTLILATIEKTVRGNPKIDGSGLEQKLSVRGIKVNSISVNYPPKKRT
ncbi:SPFH domain / Band 7 family protein [compost metagenome]